MSDKISRIFTTRPPEMNNEETARFKQMMATTTTPRDTKFPANNQAMHCWNRYNEWIVCTQNTSSDEKCKPLRQYADSICPGIWLEQFDESREEGTFGGIGSK